MTELDRTLAAFDGGRIVATAGAFSFRLRVPGADAEAAGVTAVGVAADHRRRGLLSALMRRQLDDADARREPLAVLWASEGGIYGRFGYGLASVGTHTSVDRRWSAFAEPGPVARVRLVDVDEALRVVPAIYDASRTGRAGTTRRGPR